jgi:hypothetical protein
MESRVSVGLVVLTVVLAGIGAEAKETNLCNRYPPLLGFQIDKVRASGAKAFPCD